MQKKIKKFRIAVACFLFLWLVPEKGTCQRNNFEKGFYITLKNDTIKGLMKNEESMYLVFKNEKGRQKKFSPSQIKGFTIMGKEYIPFYLKEFDLKFYLAVRQKGYITLLQYEHINSRNHYYPSLDVATLAVADEAYFRSRVSGYYIKKTGNDTLFAVPGGKNLLAGFIITHFSDNAELVSRANKGEFSISDIHQIISIYNYYAILKKRINCSCLNSMQIKKI